MPRCCCSRILTTSKGVTMTSASVMPAANPAPIRRTSDSLPSCSKAATPLFLSFCVRLTYDLADTSILLAKHHVLCLHAAHVPW